MRYLIDLIEIHMRSRCDISMRPRALSPLNHEIGEKFHRQMRVDARGRLIHYSKAPPDVAHTLILPTHIRSLGRSVLHMLRHLRHDALKHCRGRITHADVAPAFVAVRLAVAVFEGGDFVLVFWTVKKVLHEMNCVVEVPSVHDAHGDVQLADELRS